MANFLISVSNSNALMWKSGFSTRVIAYRLKDIVSAIDARASWLTLLEYHAIWTS